MLFLNLGKLPCSSWEHKKIIRALFVFFFEWQNRETRCLFPLTVKQINNLASNDESNFIIDGAEVNNVMFCFYYISKTWVFFLIFKKEWIMSFVFSKKKCLGYNCGEGIPQGRQGQRVLLFS